ncbi:hypothetical protein ACIA6D_43565 [Streptomyces cacaoi]|uniref:hypothetical protein n=1 Tax=Streptomyces cacaoi TaxID=1898 RepID=UPI0037496E42
MEEVDVGEGSRLGSLARQEMLDDVALFCEQRLGGGEDRMLGYGGQQADPHVAVNSPGPGCPLEAGQ